jgi:hypothetical protein
MMKKKETPVQTQETELQDPYQDDLYLLVAELQDCEEQDRYEYLMQRLSKIVG